MADDKFQKLGQEIGALVDVKNEKYGNSFAESHKILTILFPNGIPVEKYPDALAITRILDKLFRIATDRDALGESPYRDIAGYGILGAHRVETERFGHLDRPILKFEGKKRVHEKDCAFPHSDTSLCPKPGGISGGPVEVPRG